MMRHRRRANADARLVINVVHRRDLLLGAAASAGLLALIGAAHAQDKPAPTVSELDAALKKILGDAKPVDGKLTLDIPEIAENGNTVPFTLSVDSPMTEMDFVKSIHILSGGNPQPGIASFSFTPESGRAFASSRMRLAKTQDIAVVAEMSDGRFLVSRKTVKVTIGGCGG